jgi:sporulation protein YlmC with PRC-barrel domain
MMGGAMKYTVTVKELLGKEVLDVNAKVVGKIADINLDIEKATILSIVLKTGLIKKAYIFPRDIEKIGDKIVLRITENEIQKA